MRIVQNMEHNDKKFLDLFPEISVDENTMEILKHVEVTSINVYKKSCSLEISIVSDVLISAQVLEAIEKSIIKSFQLKSISLKVSFKTGLSLEECIAQYWDSILNLANKKNHVSRSILSDCNWELKDKKLIIGLKAKGNNIFKSKAFDIELEDLIFEMFSQRVKVEFQDVEINEEVTKEYYKKKVDEENKIIDIALKEKGPGKSRRGKRKLDNSGSYQSSAEDIIIGKSIKENITQMIEVTQESGKVAIRGEIFKVEFREIRGDRYIYIFDMTDFTSSLTVKFFVEKGDIDIMKERIKPGIIAKVKGETQYDKFSKELIVFASDIIEVEDETRLDAAVVKRVELHLHTQMSAMDGITPVKELVKRAASWGHKAIAITDHGVVQAYPAAYKAAKENNIKIIYGVECYLIDDSISTVSEDATQLASEDNAEVENDDYKKADSYHAIIIVKNYIGLKNLYKIISQSHLKYHYKKPRVPKKLFKKYREGLLIGSACEAGELYRAILNDESDDVIEGFAKFYDYLEIQPLGNNQFLINNGKIESQEGLMNINRKIVSLGEKFKKPVVATCDVHFMDARDEVFRRILMSGQGFADADVQAPLFLRTTDEMLSEFAYLGEEKAYEVVIQNTNIIADMVEDVDPVPTGTFPPKLEGSEEEIESMANKRAKEIYGEPLPEIVEARLKKELNSIIKNGFAVMYLIAQKLVTKSTSEGYLVGSRGSVGSSFVAHLVGITEVNSLQPHYICSKCRFSEFILDGVIDCGFDLPDKCCPNCGAVLNKDGYDIPFETFLGFEGDKEPDIDLNFSGDYQAIAHKYIEELFGKNHVFRAGTISSIADKTAYGFVKNYLDDRGIIVSTAEINRLVKGCTGIKKTTGQHPGGIMVIPQDKDIFDFSPIQRPADATESNVTTTHFDYHFLHGKILKLDILGHDDPTAIRMLEDLTGVDAKTIPIGEMKTMSLFSGTEHIGAKAKDINSEVGTIAIPEFGTRFVRQMLVDTMPKTFSELVRISGLSHGTDVWLNNTQKIIRDQTAKLAECICCRDDIMIYLIHKGLPPKTAFSITEDVRNGRGLKPEYEDVMNENKVPKWYIESCKKIKYLFPKAHAAAYVMMAFRIAWFKVYYPEAFYVTYFTVRADDFDAELMTHGQDLVKNKIKELDQKGNNLTQKEKNVLTILEVVNEMYARKIKFLPIDLYKSDAEKFQITDGGIRPPLNALQGLGTTAAQNIVESRKDGTFLSFDELRLKAKVSKLVIDILQKHGCLDGMPVSNQLSFF